jgi:drug/metabolite transporter (DMT)-like permease
MMTPIAVDRPQNLKLGVLYGILSSFSFAIMSVFVKLIGKDLPVSMLLFFRFATSLILIIPWLFADPHFTFKIYQPSQYVIRIFSALFALFCVFYAIKFMPLVDTLLLNNTAPLFVPIIAFILTGARTPKKALWGIILGFIGVGIILNPSKEIFSSPVSLIALASGIFAALAIVQMRIISKSSAMNQMLFYYFFVSTIATGLVAIFQWQSPANLYLWMLLLNIGIFGTLYQLFATLSYVTAPVRLMSPLFFLIVIFGGLFDWVLWNHLPSFLTILGAILVIVGAMITVYCGQKEIFATTNN